MSFFALGPVEYLFPMTHRAIVSYYAEHKIAWIQTHAMKSFLSFRGSGAGFFSRKDLMTIPIEQSI